MNREELKKSEIRNTAEGSEHQAEIRCPIHNCLIGHYDERFGCINATFYCPKCKAELTFTIKGKNN